MKIECLVKVTVVIFVILLLSNTGFAAWNRTLVGTAPNVLNQLCVGNGRNDGVQRVYAVCEDGHLYEWTFSGTGWSRVDMGAAGGTGWCLGIYMGVGRNDGRNRLYMTRINGHVYEYNYSGTNWVITDLGSPNSSLYGVVVGPGRNDATNRVYACGDGVPTVEYTWSGSAWLKDTVEAGTPHQWLPEIGNGRNDGVNRLYSPTGSGTPYVVAEYTWTGSSFSRANLPNVANNPLSIAIGPGRNDGLNRVYSSSRAKVYEFTYQGGLWQTADILPAQGNEARYDIFLGRARSDGRIRAYITCSGTQLLEATWNGSAWIDSTVDAVSSATCGVWVGRGRNDDTVRVYGCNRNGQVYEFTNSSPNVIVVSETPVDISRPAALGQNYPNPFHDHTRIDFVIKEAGRVKLIVYNSIGKKVRTLTMQMQKPGCYTVEWDGRGDRGERLPAGVYFYRLKVGGLTETKNLLIMNRRQQL